MSLRQSFTDRGSFMCFCFRIKHVQNEKKNNVILNKEFKKTMNNSHSQKGLELFFKTNIRSMKVTSIAEAPRGAFCNNFGDN